jgi:hypothetical protein
MSSSTYGEGPRLTRLRAPFLRTALCAALAATVSSVGLVASGAGAPVGAAHLTARSTSVPASTSTLALHVVGKVNLTRIAGTAAAFSSRSRVEGPNYPHHSTPLGLVHQPNAFSTRALMASSSSLPKASLDSIGGNVKGEHSLNGISALVNSSYNSPQLGGVGDVTPPDQGLGVGPGPSGSTALLEMVNDTFAAYSPSGKRLIAPLAAFQVFDQPPTTFMSDPRVYWDPQSGHWFLTMFAVPALGGSGTGPYGCVNGGVIENGCNSAQFVAVSVTKKALGTYKVFWFDTTDGTNSTSEVPGPGGHIGDDCPCFGDYDMVGMDNSGLYISTNEFCFNSSPSCTPVQQGGTNQTGGFNGTVIYAISKSGLIAAADGKGNAPAAQRYGVDTLTDPFAAYHLAPSSVTQGSHAPSTEYFVESNANLPGDPTATTSGLEVFALLHTARLATGGTPTFASTKVGTEKYTAIPPAAVQESGPIPYGNLAGTGTTPGLQTDFNAVQEVTFASGHLYAELDTGLALGTQENAGAAWFVLNPQPASSSLTASKAANGYVETNQDVLYPDISVNATGQGYMAFALAGPGMYPSAAYVSFNGTKGTGHTVYVAAAGSNPLDDFSCYPASGVSGDCRYGDYSMAQQYHGTTYMATEYVPSGARDTYANWGTRLYDAPTP